MLSSTLLFIDSFLLRVLLLQGKSLGRLAKVTFLKVGTETCQAFQISGQYGTLQIGLALMFAGV